MKPEVSAVGEADVVPDPHSMDLMSDQHLGEHELTGYLDDDLVPAELRRVREHLEQCAGCREELTAVRRLLATSPSDVTPAAHAPAPGRRRTWAAAGWLAAAGIAAVLLVRPASPPVELERAAPAATLPEGMAPLLTYSPAPDASLPSGELRFAWAPAAAESYRVTVTAADGALLWSAVVADTTATPPPDLELFTGRRYFWYVDAVGAGVVARSAAASFTIAP